MRTAVLQVRSHVTAVASWYSLQLVIATLSISLFLSLFLSCCCDSQVTWATKINPILINIHTRASRIWFRIHVAPLSSSHRTTFHQKRQRVTFCSRFVLSYTLFRRVTKHEVCISSTQHIFLRLSILVQRFYTFRIRSFHDRVNNAQINPVFVTFRHDFFEIGI